MFSTYNSTTYQSYNNCYTYALSYYVNLKTGSKFRFNGQNPGEMGGSSTITSTSDLKDVATAKSKIEAGLTKDFTYFGGTWKEISAEDQPRDGYFKVALVLAPNVDYHWYRQIPNGSWTHKPSYLAARDSDASSFLIYQPETCDRLHIKEGEGVPDYTKFIAYYEFKILTGASPKSAFSVKEEVVYPINYNLTFEEVLSLTSGTPYDEAMEVLGQAHGYYGSGLIGSVYQLVDGADITVYFCNDVIDQIRIYYEDGSYNTIVE